MFELLFFGSRRPNEVGPLPNYFRHIIFDHLIISIFDVEFSGTIELIDRSRSRTPAGASKLPLHVRSSSRFYAAQYEMKVNRKA